MPNKYIPLGKRIVWEGYKTPVNDANLNNIESRIQNISDYLEYIQQAGMVIGKGVIIGDDSKPINDMTYLVLREGDIDVAHFSFDDITFFHNTPTNAAATYKPLLHIHRNNSNNSNNSFMTFDGEYRVTKRIGIGNSDEDAVFLCRTDLEKLKQFTQNGKGSVVPPIDNTDIANRGYVDTVASGKVDKLEPLDNAEGLYTVRQDGSCYLKRSSYSNVPYSNVSRDENGNSFISDPVQNGHIANKKYVDDGLSIKLNLKKNVTEKSQVYVKRNDGTQEMLDLSSGAERFSVVFVGANGRYSAQYPINDGDVANKKYVDETNPVKDGVLKVGNTEITEEQLKDTLDFIFLSFSLDFRNGNTVEFIYKRGMTWKEFIKSDYSKGKFYAEDDTKPVQYRNLGSIHDICDFNDFYQYEADTIDSLRYYAE